MTIENKMCSKCRTIYPLTAEYWPRNRSAKNGFYGYCKGCKNRLQNANRVKKNNLKQIEEINKRMEIINKKELEDAGLKPDNLKLKIGQVYKINIPTRGKARKYFIGRLEHITDKIMIFRHEKGYCESFLKADLLLEHKFEEVS